VEYRFNEQATAVLRRAERAADLAEHALITPDHLLVGILLEPASTARRVLSLAGVDASRLGFGAFVDVPARDQHSADRPAWNRSTRKVIRRAFFESFSMDKTTIGTEHLLVGLAGAKEDRVADALERNGLSVRQAEEYVRALAGDPLVVAQQELTTAPAVEAIRRAVERAVGERAEATTEDHLLWSLGQISGHAADILGQCNYHHGGPAMRLVSSVRGPVPDSRRILEVIHKALSWADRLEHRHVGSEHLLLSLVANRSSEGRRMQRLLTTPAAELEVMVKRQIADKGAEAKFSRPEVDVALAGQWFSRYSGEAFLTGH
jgi:ATP-dependent Clp protease ATP-binding subunit ClpA